MKRLLRIAIFLFVVFYSSLSQAQQCNIIYVTPNGATSGAAGTLANPASLTYGLTLVTASANQLWLAAGTYTISTALFIPSNVIIEGGFTPPSWIKSNGTPSIIFRDATNPAGPPANALFALVGNAVSGFRLQDLTIQTANAPGNGISVYGIYLTGCSNYNIVRCDVSTGAASAGTTGTTGTAGTAGGNGNPGNPGILEPGPIPGGIGGTGANNGGNGANVTGYDTQNPGSASPAPCNTPGGAGGWGPSCSAGCFFGPPGCSGTTPGQPGQNGSIGTAGTIGTTGSAGSIAACYFVPGVAGGNGGNGTDGCGGGGGGMGGGQQENGPDDWGGSGGGGGGGGYGGTGGTGGTGGGAAFAVFLCNNGAGGNITDCFLNPGPAGAGGSGGSGGAGGAGGTGGAGGAAGVCSAGVGGKGGNGGAGGAGGAGGSGAAGISIALSENGGTLVTQSNITSVPGNPPIISVLNHGCTNAEVVFTAASSGAWNFGTGASPATGNGAGPISVYYSSQGRKTINFSGTNFTDFINIFQNGTTYPISPANATIAAGCPTTFNSSSGGTYYQWYFPTSAQPDSVVGASATAANGIIFFNPGTYTIYLYVTTQCCGRVIDSTQVTVLPSTLNISLAPSPAKVCAGSSLMFTATPATYIGYDFFVNGVSVQNGSSNTYTSSTLQNNDSVMVIVTNGSCFNGTQAITVTVNPVPTATISPVTNVNCFGGNTGSATVNAATGSSPFTYSWSNSQNGQTASNLTAGNYSVLITDANGCTTTQTVTITQPATALTSSVTSTNISCNGMNNGSATLTASGGTGNFTYTWNPNVASTNSASNLSAGNYIVTVTDANGCTKTNSFTITQPAVLTASVISQNVSCFGMNNGSASLNASGGTGTYSYAWNPSGGNSSSASNLAPGNYSVTVTDANGCSNTNTLTISQPTVLTASVSSTNISCFGANDGTANVSASGGTPMYTYAWNPPASTGPTASGMNAGNYTVIVYDANGCSHMNSLTITQPPAINVSTFQNNVSCNGLSDGSAIANASGGAGTFTYSWNPSGGNASTTSGLSAGNYSITVTDMNGCTTTSTLSITQPATLSASIPIINATCGNNDGKANATPSGGTLPFTYSWSNGQSSQSATGLTPYSTYTLTVTDANGCSFTDTISTKQDPPPVASVTGDTVLCNGSSSVLTASGGLSYIWNTFATSPSITVSPSATTSYSVIVTDGNCKDTAAITVVVNPVPTASAGNDTTIMQFQSTVLAGSSGSNGVSYQWFPQSDLSCYNCATPSASPQTTTTYYVIITDANGCTNIDSVTVFVTPIECTDPYLPNAFSPNGDGDNDWLQVYVKVPECLKDLKLTVWNRWGEKVFYTEEKNFQWDGTYNKAVFRGTDAGTEVFVYRLEATVYPDKEYKKTGNISLVR